MVLSTTTEIKEVKACNVEMAVVHNVPCIVSEFLLSMHSKADATGHKIALTTSM